MLRSVVTASIAAARVAATGLAHAYRCALGFILTEEGRTLTLAAGRLADPAAAERRASFKPAPGARFVYEVTGMF
jgi:hypothetical protein